MTTFSDADYLSSVLDDVLNAGDAALTAAGRPVSVLVKSPGIPSWDCEGLYVWPRTFTAGLDLTQNARAMQRQVKIAAAVNVLLIRCITSVTNSGIPDATVVDSDGNGFAIDMWALQRGYVEAALDGTLFTTVGCVIARMQPIMPATPQGGFSGMTTTIEVALG